MPLTETQLDAVNEYLKQRVVAVGSQDLAVSFELGLKQVFIEAFLMDEAAAQAAFEDFDVLLADEADPHNHVFWQDCAYAIIEDQYDLLTSQAKADVLARIGA